MRPSAVRGTISSAPLARYIVALASVAAGAAVCAALAAAGAGHVALLVMMGPVLVSSGYGGLVPGLLATCIGGLAGLVSVLDAGGENALSPAIGLGIFCALGAAVSWLNERLHRAARTQQDAAVRE